MTPLDQQLAECLGTPVKSWEVDEHKIDLSLLSKDEMSLVVREVISEVSFAFYNGNAEQDSYDYYEQVLRVPNTVIMRAIIKVKK